MIGRCQSFKFERIFFFVFERNVNAETLATSTQNKNNEENKKVQKLDKLSSRNCEIEKLC